MCCPQCFAIPQITIQLIGTSACLLYGQRVLYKNSQWKWANRITLLISILIAILLSSLGIFLFVLTVFPEYRKSGFAYFCGRQNKTPSPLDEHRCALLGNITGRVIEFGPGPGTNFRCFENYTADDIQSIEKYVAVEPNSYFEEAMRNEQERLGLAQLPLQFVGLRGEDVDIGEDEYGTYDVVFFTHVLCSVDSVESVLANADRALKPGGKMIFMEHALAHEERSFLWYSQKITAPVMNIIGNGCQFKDIGANIKSYFGDKYIIDYFVEFDASMPKPLYFVTPHVKGIVTKK
eukprot:1225_1